MKQNISLLLAAVLLLTLTTGCRKKNAPMEATTLPAAEATATTTEETTAPTVDVLKQPPSAFEDKPEETLAETTPDATKPAAITSPETDAPAPPPEDESDNDLGWG